MEKQNFESINETIFNQKIDLLKIEKLKGLIDLEIEFSNSPLTAILGPNGSGKSTILHALACCYQPFRNVKNRSMSNKNEYEKAVDYQFPMFFPRTIHSPWNGSKFHLFHSYSYKNNNSKKLEIINDSCVQTTYDKMIKSGSNARWSPRYFRRPARNVCYLGLREFVPEIEKKTKTEFIKYVVEKYSSQGIKTSKELEDNATWIRENASQIMNRDYSDIFSCKVNERKRYLGTSYNGIEYASLSMGAGEQRIFLILEELSLLPNNSLVLIDELDLLLHDDALRELVKVLFDRCKRKDEKKDNPRLQVVFTAHSPAVTELTDLVNIRHIYQNKSKTYCLVNTKTETLRRLTNRELVNRKVACFVEDSMACSIVEIIASECQLRPYINITQYGSVQNAFTMASAKYLEKQTENILIILDGDTHRERDEKIAQIKNYLTGTGLSPTGESIEDARENALKLIVQFSIPENINLEEYLLSLLKNCESDFPEDQELIEIARSIVVVAQDKHPIREITHRMSSTTNQEVDLHKILQVIVKNKQTEWRGFTQKIRDWLLSKKSELLEYPRTTKSIDEIKSGQISIDF